RARSSLANTRSPSAHPTRTAGAAAAKTLPADADTWPAAANATTVATLWTKKTPASVARNTTGSSPRAWSATTNGGPEVPVLVARTPLTKPAPASTTVPRTRRVHPRASTNADTITSRSEEHTSELQSRGHLV